MERSVHFREIAHILDSLDVAALLLDPEDRTIFWNPSFLRTFPEHDGHIHAGEHYSENLRRFYRARLDATEIGNIDRYIADGVRRHQQQSAPFEFMHRGQWLRAASLPITDTGRARIWTRIPFSGSTDTLADRMADSGKDAYAGSIDQIADGLMVRDASGIIVSVNRRFLELYVLNAAEDVIGSTYPELLDAVWGNAPDGDAARQSWLDNSRFAGAPFEVVLPGGRCFRVRERRALGGCFISTHVDITDLYRLQQGTAAARRRAEDLAESLRNEIAERKRAEAQTISVARLASLGEMAASLAHELNQPLATVSLAATNATRALASGGADAIPDALARLARIGQQAVRAGEIVNHLQTFGNAYGGSEEARGPIDIAELVRRALMLTGTRLKLASIDLALDIPPDLPRAEGHMLQLEQALLSLLTNAREVLETRRSGGRMIRIGALRRGEEVVLTVSDNAGGFTPAVLEKALIPFFTTKPAGEGLGLGLAVAFSGIRAMGGHLALANGPEGAVVTITLPVSGRAR